MLRTFDEHKVRKTESLDGFWDFAVAGQSSEQTDGLPTEYPDKIAVPSAWESKPGLENHRGRAWYKTHISGCGSDRAVRLIFGGVSHTGTVFVDGCRVGQHYDAYTPWDVVLPELSEDLHELVIEVDNTFGEHSALHGESDYYTYGGITRPVVRQVVPLLYIDKVRATPEKTDSGWRLQVEVSLRNTSSKKIKGRVEVDVAGKTLDLGAAVEGRQLLMNDEPLQLRGFNRHEDHPQFGCALPLEAMINDLNLIRDMGANFIRTSHYPNDMRFLDMCDELGFYVWEEPHGKGFQFDEPNYHEQMFNSAGEMLAWHHNHPAILMWGFLNESDSTTENGHREHEKLARFIRDTDPSRPITFATNKGRDDICLDLVDIVSWNRYDAWYGGGPEDVAAELETIMEWLDSPDSNGGSGKPVIMSEFGGGAFYGYRSPAEPKWSEDYQERVIDESLRVYLNHLAIIGTAIWQFCDVRATSGTWRGRPREMNNKGIVDEFRRPKLAYKPVKCHYKSE